MSMKAIIVERPGDAQVMRYGDVPTRQPGKDEVLIRTAAIGVNYLDVYHRSGTYPIAPGPFTPGMEASGTVEAVGSGVKDFEPGDRVAYTGVLGSYTQLSVVPASKLVAVPANISFEQAAAIMLQGMTAHYLANATFPLKHGDVALVHAGAGGVGLLLTQLAKARGATVITTVSTQAKEQLSKEAGADHVIRYTEDDFAAQARRITGGRGVDVVYDSVGKTTFEKSLDSLRPRGMMVLFGGSSGQVPPLDLQVLNLKGSLFITRPNLAHYIAERAELEQRAGDLFNAVERGTLKLRIERTYPLSDASRAHTDLAARKTTGKLLLIP
jgi:NADPH2:quinone reductase